MVEEASSLARSARKDSPTGEIRYPTAAVDTQEKTSQDEEVMFRRPEFYKKDEVVFISVLE